MRTQLLSRSLLWGVIWLACGCLASSLNIGSISLERGSAFAQELEPFDPFGSDTPAPAPKKTSKEKPVVEDPFGSDATSPVEEKPAEVKPASDDDPFRPGATIPPSWRAGAPAADDPFAEGFKPRPEISDEELQKRAANTITFLDGEIPAPLTNEQLHKKLQEETSFQFVDLPLGHALEELKKLHEIPLQLELDAIEQMSRETITLELSRISLESALELMLAPLNLDFILEDGVLVVATNEYLESHPYTRVYPVRELIQYPGVSGLEEDASSLIHLIEETIEPESWDNVGGSGNLAEFDGQLVVLQTRKVHREVERLLAVLSKLPALDFTELGQQLEPIPLQKHDARSSRLVAALEEPLKVEFDWTPLSEIVKPLSRQYGIRVSLDTFALKNAQVSAATRIRMKEPRVKLGTSLKLALQDLDLDYVVHSEVLLITSKQKTESIRSAVAYPVIDLLPLPAEPLQGDLLASMDRLKQAIEKSIDPNTWDAVGGRGIVRSYVSGGVLLVVSNKQVHAKIVDALAKMRAVKATQPAQPKSAFVAESQVLVVGYELIYDPPAKNEKGELIGKAVERADTQRLADMIQTVVAPESWQTNKQAYIRAFPDRLLVRHEKQVQREIEIVLNQLGLQFLSGADDEGPELRVKGGRFLTPQQRRRIDFGRNLGGNASGFVGGSVFNVPAE